MRIIRLDVLRSLGHLHNKTIRLTAQETQVLKLLATTAVLKRSSWRGIAKDQGLSVVISRLRKKLGRAVIDTVTYEGYILGEHERIRFV